MKKLIAFVAVVALATPAFGRTVQLSMPPVDNGDGSTSYWFEIDSLPEVSFMELSIMGELHQVQAHSPNYEAFGPPYAPNVTFTSDQNIANFTDPEYAANAHLDTVIDDEHWIGVVQNDLMPDNGDALDGTQGMFVALTSFTGPGQGGPLPGGFIPLAHVTIWGDDLWITGRLQSDGDEDGRFEWHTPEPSTLALAGFGMMGLVAGMRRRRS